MFSTLKHLTLASLVFASFVGSAAFGHEFIRTQDYAAAKRSFNINPSAPPMVSSNPDEQAPRSEAKNEDTGAAKAAATLVPQEAQMAPTSVPVATPVTTDSQQVSKSASDNGQPVQAQEGKETASSAPLQGHLVKRGLEIRSLPVGLTPDFIIGHFAFTIGPFIRVPVEKPLGNIAGFAAKFVKKWHGKQIRSCQIRLKKIPDGSGGYYFKTIGHEDGPRGWLMPMPKVPNKDRVTPWAIFFDQPDANQTPSDK